MIERPRLFDATRRYANTMHNVIGADHHVASPFGAWLLLAVTASATTGARRINVERALGMDVQTAQRLAGRLLDAPHPALALASAAWIDDKRRTVGFDEWERGLPEAIERGPVPSQSAADRWTSERTLGLLNRFPIELTEYTKAVLATIVATRVAWADPFQVADARELWPDSAPPVSRVLRAVPEHRMLIAETDAAGDVAVHAAHSSDGLLVTSVIATPDTPHTAVLDAAYQVANGLAGRSHRLRVRSLFDLPTGDDPRWTITEEPVTTREPTGREERYEALLPAWTATSEHDLLQSLRLGLRIAGDAITDLLRPDAYGTQLEAVQSVVAEYGRHGFSAAALSALAFQPIGMPSPSRPGLRRTARLRFAGPYAVVAVAVDPPAQPAQPPSPWSGLPVFSAWVTEPTEA